MQKTTLEYLSDSYRYTSLVSILEKGLDEKGEYLILDKTIYYPGGGGQPKDNAQISFRNSNEAKIIGADYNDGFVKHYFEGDLSNYNTGMQSVAMLVSQNSRKLYSAYHTAGHWIASIVHENLCLPFIPLKGYHYPEGAYVEFDGDKNLINDAILEDIRYAMMIDRQADLKLKWDIISAADKEALKKAFIPNNFNPNMDKPIRIVTMDNYKGVPCGGTHIYSLREIKSALPTKIALKNGKIRISYECQIEEITYPS